MPLVGSSRQDGAPAKTLEGMSTLVGCSWETLRVTAAEASRAVVLGQEAPIPSSGESDRIFFVHVMKTGGTTLSHNVQANVEPEQIFPNSSDPGFTLFDHMRVGPFLTIPPEQDRQISWFSGHVTLALAEERFPDARTLVLLRDPVERTLSYLRHCQKYHSEHRDLPIEAIYEDEWFFTRFIQDHQTRILSMTLAETLAGSPSELVSRIEADPALEIELARQIERDGPSARLMFELTDRAPTEAVVVDDRRLAVAQAALERIDLLALTSQIGALLEHLSAERAWRTSAYVLNATVPQEAPPGLRRRIAADNQADLELYARAVELTRSGPHITR